MAQENENAAGPSYGTKLAMSVAGIMGFFIYYGVLQETIMNEPYGKTDSGEDVYFTDSTFLVFSNRLFAAIIAVIIVKYRGESLKNVAPLQKYLGVSLSNFCATWCQYEALKYVNFPTQTLGKCGKMMPVMLVGTFISGNKYTLKDYLIAFSVTAGCMIFFLSGKISSSDDDGSTPYGLILMAAYMFFDSFTSTFQEKMFKGYTMTTYDQMIYVNSFSALICLFTLMLNGRLFPAMEFAMTHQKFVYDSTFLSICASLGQLVIYYTIKEFGALIFSTIMVTRQVFSILLSTVLFSHQLSNAQWFGAFLVFGTLYYKTAEDQKKRKSGHGHSHGHGGSSSHSHSHSAPQQSTQSSPIEIGDNKERN
ncbi:hypothetical protein PPL_05108 [Heterostelium album PN500]|uniref:Uncharacterized protein n=1 Tax=Heterostelium pallidum (strain ATCC 26659 / Pp 5 / PN500) TaxID=670386 RepID=D3B9G4_HETP5|nr:hypothetical protein PPL_05108 [Heterostelium album PN500]EFA81876.1 hypothetical protein PPL_05108 [Heterostelium album PN500]|eukprot:XP_020433993.1 hypothetical protein PPL_05108 [Heterostelium album PN500]